MRIELSTQDRVILVKEIFSRIVGRYDFLNHLLSLNRDVFWRRATAKRAKLVKTSRFLDVAAGTGDLSIALAQAWPGSTVVGLDFSYPMLAGGQEKIKFRTFNSRISLTCGDALALPFPDRSFDTVTMAFGIRNIPRKELALSEMHRVLVPGGQALILELGFPRWSFIRRFYETYLNRLLPRLGGLVSGQGAAYRYLADSIMDFPEPDCFQKLMQCAGFENTGYKPFTFGAAILHWGSTS
jgi:demethylmenaquinone methyltransferase / 2-methoxy-6-polyprenyl-1,4-benzoquinol methylase